MTLTTAQRIDAAQRLIRIATGDEYGDGETVTNLGIGYAEPGYGFNLDGTDTVWVFGNWNDRQTYDRATGQWMTTSNIPSRLATALERIGVECEWSDEWTECTECNRAIRTQPDSYSWSRSYLDTDDDERICHECLATKYDVADILDMTNAIDNPRFAFTADTMTPERLISAGFVKFNADHEYESGWHPGQTDDPADVMSGIHDEYPGSVVVFTIPEVSQFHLTFDAYYRLPDDDTDADY